MLSEDLGVVKSRVIQFLNLLRFPADLRARLRKDSNVAEGHLRPFTKMDLAGMRVAVGRLLGLRVMAKAVRRSVGGRAGFMRERTEVEGQSER